MLASRSIEKRDDAGDVGLERQRHQVEHQLEVIGDVVGHAHRRVGHVQAGVVLLRRHLHAALDLAHRVEVVADDRAVAHAEAGLQPRRLPLHAIEDAAGLGQDRPPAPSAVSPWPNSFWNTARGLPSCGSDCVGVRQARRAPTCDVVSSSDGSRVSWPMCFAASWSARDAGVRVADAVVPRLHAAQPGGLDVAVRLGRLARLVAQARHDRQVLPQRLERRQDRRHVEAGAGLRRRPAGP